MLWKKWLNIVKVENITNKFHLKDISISIEVWKISCLLWPSGWWKSSLLSCLSGIEKIDAGSISCDWTSISHPKVGLVAQWLFLRPHLTVRENITLALISRWIFDEDLFTQLVQKFGISKILNNYPLTCSWWEQQRIAIVRQLLLKPKYLLLDEVTSSLDIENIQVLIQTLQEVKNTTGILIVTHMIHFAKKIADCVYFMDQWTIIERWNTTILTSPKTLRFKEFLSLQ